MRNPTSTTSHRRGRSRLRSALPGTVGLLAVVALVSLALVVPNAGAHSPAAEVVAVHHLGFETSAAGVGPLNANSQLARVAGGHNHTKYALRLGGSAGRTTNVGLMNTQSFVASTTKGSRYIFSAWLRPNAAAASNGPLDVRVNIHEVNGTSVVINAWHEFSLSAGTWQRARVPLTARQTGSQVNVTVKIAGLPSKGLVRVDDLLVSRGGLVTPSAALLNGTPYGTSIDNGDTDFLTALGQADNRFGRLGVVRVFGNLPGSWSGMLGQLKRPFVYSFRADPKAVLAGTYDQQILDWFKGAPSAHPIWWTYMHEPEDDIERGEYTAANYRAAWQHIYNLQKGVKNPQLHPTMILMCWTLNPLSGRTFSTYYPGNFIQVLAWDCYNPPQEQGYISPQDLFGAAAQKAHSMGKKFAIAEFGSLIKPGDDGTRRARWVSRVARFAAENNAAFVSYWDAKIPGEDYQLRDLPGQSTWRAVVSATD